MIKKYFINIGDKFGRWTVLKESKDKKNSYVCRCECGTVKDIPTYNLARGYSQSCGCLHKEIVKECNLKPNQYVIMGDYVIGKTSVGHEFLFDLEDLEKIKKLSWSKGKNGYMYGKKHGEKVILMHRYIMNPPAQLMVDHINHDRVDNRKSNLRICTALENSRNRSVPPNGIRVKKSGKNTYYAVWIKGKYWGTYKDYEKAKAVRDEAWGNGYD